MPAAPTIPRRRVPTACPVRRAPDDRAAVIAASYPGDLAPAQALLAARATDALRRSDRRVSLGRYGEHLTADTAVPRGALLLVPMAELWDLHLPPRRGRRRRRRCLARHGPRRFREAP
jgi:hypothetical protein